jgi:hypothetical protein
MFSMDENVIANSTSAVNPKQEISAGYCLLPDPLYSREQLKNSLRVTDRTLQIWIRDFGLEPLSAGTKRQFFVGRNVICSMRRASRNDRSRSKNKGNRK